MPVILQEERPWRAPTHGSTHVSTGHVAEGGTSIACTMTRGSWRWERHIAPKTHRLMRALQQRHGTRGGSTYGGGRGGAAGGTGGGANGDSRDRGWNGTTYWGKWSDSGCRATISGGAGQEAESDDGATDDIRRRADGQRSGGAVGGVVGGNEWSSRNWRRRRKRRRSASSRPANAASDPPNTDDSKLRQRQQQQQNPARNVTAEPGDCTETPLVGAQSRKNGTPRASSRPADRFPAFPTTTHPAFPTWPWQLDI